MEFSALSLKWNKLIEVPIQKIQLDLFSEKKVEVFVKREDLNHTLISGNKLRKLKYNILKASELKHDTLLTFGGAFSNHIVATASAGFENGFKTIGVIRGDELEAKLDKVLLENDTLRKAYDLGMQFHFVSRAAYREKEEDFFIKNLETKYGRFYLIPEGGTNDLAVKGTREILTEDLRTADFDYITSAMGTAGTLAGLIDASHSNQIILGFPALKDSSFLNSVIETYTLKKNYRLIDTYHFGGYAKYTAELIEFINLIKEKIDLPLDPVYTGKEMYGLIDLIKNDYFEENSRILMIHTGGLQGISGFNKRLKNKNKIII